MSSTADPAFEFVRQLGEELARNEFRLPPFPDVAVRVRDALNDPDVTIDNVARIALAEPVLTTQLLRLANSALLKRGAMEITDLKTAINRLGFDMVRNAAVSLALDSSFSAPAGSPLRSRIDTTRKHSIAVCAIAYVLARRQSNISKPEEAMLAGLLHDIGEFYILTRVNDFPELFSDEQTVNALLAEWHAGVGRAIVEAWGFPEQIAEAVDEHELLDRDHFGPADIADIVIVANLLAHENDPDYTGKTDLDNVASCQRMKIGSDAMLGILEESAQEIESMAQALKA